MQKLVLNYVGKIIQKQLFSYTTPSHFPIRFTLNNITVGHLKFHKAQKWTHQITQQRYK